MKLSKQLGLNKCVKMYNSNLCLAVKKDDYRDPNEKFAKSVVAIPR